MTWEENSICQAVFLGAMDPMVPVEGVKTTILMQLKEAGKTSLAKAGSYAKGFAVFGALYTVGRCRLSPG